MKPTQGFQYEEMRDQNEVKLGLWDLGGDEACQQILPAILQAVRFKALIFVVDISDEVDGLEGGINHFHGKNKGQLPPFGHIDKARRMLHRLMAEEEMREVVTVGIVLNCKMDSPIYAKIYENHHQDGEDATPQDKKYLRIL